MESTTRDEPVTPTGRLFLHPKFNNIINCAIGFKQPPNIEAIKTLVSNCLMVKQPRFSSLLVVDKQGREFWRRTQVNFDDHIIIHTNDKSLESYSDEEQEEKINAILADFAVSSPLSTEKPLWELHIYSDLKCMIYRFHHALGDGITLMSLSLADCKRCDDQNGEHVSEKNRENRKERKKKKLGLMGILKMLWWTIVAIMGSIGRSLCVRDKKTAISGGDGVELWPRMVATAKFSLEDMKTVKRAISNATINDVLFGIISYGLSKYLDTRSSHALQEGFQITGLCMVNLRKQPGLQEMSKMMEDDVKSDKWGNQIGSILLPVYCHKKDMDPLNYVKRSKVMLDRKKQSLEAHFSYIIGKFVMSIFGPKVTSMLNYKIVCNTTFTISNILGPQEEMSFADNPMTFIRPMTTSFAHALTMHMTSYAGMANMQILVAKDIIPDPKFLAKCFEDALLEMENAASAPLTEIIIPHSPIL